MGKQNQNQNLTRTLSTSKPEVPVLSVKDILQPKTLDYFTVEAPNSASNLELVLIRAVSLEMRLHTVIPRMGTNLVVMIFEKERGGDMSHGQLKDALYGY